MSSRDSPDRWAADTSVAIAYLDAEHSAHDRCVAEMWGRSVALSGHAAFETYSVLTRMSESGRIVAADVRRAIEAAFPESCWLTPQDQEDLLRRLADAGVVGGAVYDALVAEAARLDGRVLLTRDRRARSTYDSIGVKYKIVA